MENRKKCRMIYLGILTIKRFGLNIVLAIISLTMTSCIGYKQVSPIMVNVTDAFPVKELVLQDFMDVEYVAMEITEEFSRWGDILAVGKEVILVISKNHRGDIFIYSRNGKSLRKINQKVGHDYLYGVFLDEDKGELYINNYYSDIIYVYDLYGNLKRNIKYKDNVSNINMYNYNEDNLILYNNPAQIEQSIFVVSKQDGSVVDKIEIPFIQEKETTVVQRDSNSAHYVTHLNFPVIPHKGNWIITSPSSDTVYTYLPDHNIIPFIVRTPSIQSMTPEVFLFPGILTKRYYFMETVKKEYDFEKQKGFPVKRLMYDRRKKAVYEYIVNNNDYSGRIENMSVRIINDGKGEVAFWVMLDNYSLLKANENGLLKGKLKDITAELKDKSFQVIMLVKNRK